MRSILAVFLCATALSAADAPRRAPGFALPDSKMEVHDLYDYRGKPVILEFMQSSCLHCAEFVTVLEKVQAKFGDKVQILCLANPPDNRTTVRQFIQGHKITYPILFDSGQVAFSYLKSMQFDLPQVYLIDAQGMIYAHYSYNALNRDIFEGDRLLAEVDRVLGPAVKKK